jgi:hypothetical protein
VSFDAEKAFDKIWRPGLLFKLLKKLNINITMIIKLYNDQSSGTIKNGDNLSENKFDPIMAVKQNKKKYIYIYRFPV